MTIADTTAPDKATEASWADRVGQWFGHIPKEVFIGIALILTGAAGIGIGILVAKEKGEKQDQLWIENLTAEERGTATGTPPVATVPNGTDQAAAAATAVPKPAPVPVDGIVVASKTGEVYYLPTCSAAKRITPEKLVSFTSRAEAEKAGYRAAKNCKGL